MKTVVGQSTTYTPSGPSTNPNPIIDVYFFDFFFFLSRTGNTQCILSCGNKLTELGGFGFTAPDPQPLCYSALKVGCPCAKLNSDN